MWTVEFLSERFVPRKKGETTISLDGNLKNVSEKTE